MNRLQLLPIILALFATFPCLVLAETESTLPSQAGTGLEGVISVSPILGGPTRMGVSDSKPLANTAFVVKKGNHTVTSFDTDDRGRFHISLPPGHYTISTKDSKGVVGHYGPFEVDIAAGQIKKVEWNCDTGIR
jgi:hypothetical protein